MHLFVLYDSVDDERLSQQATLTGSYCYGSDRVYRAVRTDCNCSGQLDIAIGRADDEADIAGCQC